MSYRYFKDRYAEGSYFAHVTINGQRVQVFVRRSAGKTAWVATATGIGAVGFARTRDAAINDMREKRG